MFAMVEALEAYTQQPTPGSSNSEPPEVRETRICRFRRAQSELLTVSSRSIAKTLLFYVATSSEK